MDTASINADILQHSSVMLGLLDSSGRLTTTNANWTQYLGVAQPEKGEALQLFDYLHAEDVEITRSCLEQLAKDGGALAFETRFRDAQNHFHRLHWEAHKNPESGDFQVAVIDLSRPLAAAPENLPTGVLFSENEDTPPPEGERRRQDRRRTVVALKASQARYAMAVSAGKTGIWDWDVRSEEFYFDHNLKALLGYEDSEVPNTLQAWYAMVHPEDREKIQTQMQGVIKGRINELEVDRRMLHKDGSIRWFVARATVLRDDQGEVYRLVGIDTDISERKQIGLMLQARDKLLRATSQAAQQLLTLPDYNTALQQVLITLGDATGVDRITIFSHEQQPGMSEHHAKPIFTWASEQLKQRSLPLTYEATTYKSEQDSPDWNRDLASNRSVVLQVGELPSKERKLLESMGVRSTLLIPLYVKPYFRHYIVFDDCHEARQWPDHEISMLQVVGDSIRACMARQRVEEARRLSEQRRQEQIERNHMILEAAMDGFCVSSVDGRVIEVNPAFCDMLGYSNESELMFAGFVTLAMQDTQSALKQHIELTVKNGAHRFETQLRDRHGNPVDVDISSHVVRFSDKAGDGLFFSFLRDIRERKETERELRQAKLDAEQAGRAKTEFLTTMNHELHTPMSGIIGTAELLLKTSLNLQQQNYVDMLYGSAKSLLNLIQDILEFSRAESSRMELEVSDFNLHELVENTFNLFTSTVHDKGVEYVCHLPPDLPLLLRGDPARLRQVLVSLISNAVKFTDNGEVIVQINARVPNNREAPCKLRFEIKDTGIGISAEDLKKLFQPFAVGDHSNTRRHSGAGLGLVLARRIVQMMGGDIHVSSTLGQGSVFWFELNLPRSPAQPSAKPSYRALKGYKTLVVDDNAASRAMLLSQLRAWGMQAEAAEDGKQALDTMLHSASQKEGFDLVVVDAIMPGMSGHTLLQRIKSDSNLSKIPVIMLTSMSQPIEPELTAKLAGYTSKPVNQSKLLACLLNINKQMPTIVEQPKTHETSVQEQAVPAPVQKASRDAIPVNPDAVTSLISKPSAVVSHEAQEAQSLEEPQEEFTPVMPYDENALIDKYILAQLRKNHQGGGIDWLIDLYLSELPRHLRHLRSAFNNGDVGLLLLSAQKFKTVSEGIGATGVVARCDELATVGDVEKRRGYVEELLKTLQSECDKLRFLLEQERYSEL